MRTLHFGIACSSEQNADLFYGDLLGLTRQEPKTIPAAVVQPLFGLDMPLPALNYLGTALHVEVFLTGSTRMPDNRITHVCLEVENAATLLERAESSGLTVRRIPKGNGWIFFLDDPDGNRYEIKQTVTG